MLAAQATAHIDQIESYQNPWDAAASAGNAEPMSRRDAIRHRASAKRRAAIRAEQELEQTAWQNREEAEAEAAAAAAEVDAEVETADEPSPKKAKKSGKNEKPGKSGKNGKPGKSEVWALSPQNIPIENLPNGVINVLGDGLASVVDTGISAGNSITSAVKVGARAVPVVAATGMVGVAGVGMIYGYATNLPFVVKVF
jgi:hypothetical protein